jgi:hypothetical protein
VYKTAERLIRMYSEWMSGDIAWRMQVRIPLVLGRYCNSYFSVILVGPAQWSYSVRYHLVFR